MVYEKRGIHKKIFFLSDLALRFSLKIAKDTINKRQKPMEQNIYVNMHLCKKYVYFVSAL